MITPGSELPVVESVCGSLKMRRRAALAIIVIVCTIFKLDEIKDHEKSTLHEHCVKIAQAKKGPSNVHFALF